MDTDKYSESEKSKYLRNYDLKCCVILREQNLAFVVSS